MPIRSAQAVWQGDLPSGKGTFKTGSGSIELGYSFPSRFESGEGSNPEELIAAAHASCYAMAFSHALAGAGYTPENVAVEAKVTLDKVEDGFAITNIALHCDATVAGIEDEKFQTIATDAKNNCPVSKALAATEITLEAKLNS